MDLEDLIEELALILEQKGNTPLEVETSDGDYFEIGKVSFAHDRTYITTSPD